jgi:sporulation protein YlmC with PRC-barrel domain
MVLSELLGLEAVAEDGLRLGRIRDVRLRLTDDRGARGLELRVSHLIVGQSALAERLGYAYGPVEGPRILRVIMRRRGRHLRAIPWASVTRVEPRRVVVSAHPDELRHPRTGPE